MNRDSRLQAVVHFYDFHPISAQQILAAVAARSIDRAAITEEVLQHHDQDHYGGLDAVERLRTNTARWLREHGYESLAQMRGSMDISRTPDPRAFERGNYMRLLQTYRVE